MKYQEILDNFKGRQNAENIYPVMEEPGLRRAMLSWPSVKVVIDPSSYQLDCPFSSDRDKWDWLWDKARMDISDFAMKCGYKVQDAQAVFEQLKALQLIYPDNTVNKLASLYLRSKAHREISKMSTPKRAPDNAEPS
jgi:hypothetical protein